MLVFHTFTQCVEKVHNFNFGTVYYTLNKSSIKTAFGNPAGESRRKHYQITIIMKKQGQKMLGLALGVIMGAGLLNAQTVDVGGAAMYPTRNIIENAMNSKDHSTLVAAVKAAGLVETLQGKGPFTVFAPTNDAFENLPAGTLDMLLKPENNAKLAGILTYHVVPATESFETISKKIKAGGGKAEIVTVNGGKIWVMMNGPRNIVVKDEGGNVANISVYDVVQSNGMIHSIDKVLMPK